MKKIRRAHVGSTTGSKDVGVNSTLVDWFFITNSFVVDSTSLCADRSLREVEKWLVKVDETSKSRRRMYFFRTLRNLNTHRTERGLMREGERELAERMPVCGLCTLRWDTSG